MTTVPNVTGMSRRGARARIERRDLVFDDVLRDSVRQPKGRVVSQRPAAGTPLQAGDTVQVTISDGPPPVDVPDLENSSIAAASRALAQRRLTVAGTRAVPSGRPAGTVIRTEPSAGASVPRGTSVTLVVARAKAWRTVGTYKLTADGSTPSFTITSSKWRLTYTMVGCRYGCPSIAIEGDSYDWVSLAEGTHTTFGPADAGDYRITSSGGGSYSYRLTITVSQYS